MSNKLPKVKPLGENILLQAIKEKAATKSGLVLPESSLQDRPQQAKVRAVGESIKIKVKKGQQVIFAKYSGSEIKIGEDDYIILKNEDILALVEKRTHYSHIKYKPVNRKTGLYFLYSKLH